MLALAGAGLQLGGYQYPLLGKIFLIGAALLAVGGAASIWIQQYWELRTARVTLQQNSSEAQTFDEKTEGLSPQHPEQDKELEAKLEEREREIRRLNRKVANQRAGGVGGATITSAEIPEGMVAERHIVGGSHLLERVLELADEGSRLTGWTFEECWLIGPAVVAFTGSTTIEGVEVKGSPDTVLYRVDSYGDEASGCIQLDSCTFKDCRFGRMGLAGTSEDQQWLREKFTFTLP